MANMLTKEDVLGAQDTVIERVEVPEWGGYVFIKVMSGAERDRYDAMLMNKDLTNYRARFLVRVLCDEKGNRVFRDEDAFKLGQKSAKVLDKLFAIAQKLNGLDEKAVEEAEKNFADARSGGSGLP